MMLRRFYIVVTACMKWGKALDRQEALKNAQLPKKTNTEHVVYIGIVKPEATDGELENILKCFEVFDWGGVKMYSDPTPEDRGMVKRLFIGWVKEHINVPKSKKVKVN